MSKTRSYSPWMQENSQGESKMFYDIWDFPEEFHNSLLKLYPGQELIIAGYKIVYMHPEYMFVKDSLKDMLNKLAKEKENSK